MNKLKLSGNTLKIIAAISMFIDHFGMIFYPHVAIFRIIGRLAYPIFAFCIAEGCKYTKNKKRYFLRKFVIAVMCQVIYTIVEKELYMNILITFSLSIIMIYAFIPFLENHDFKSGFIFLLTVSAVYILTTFVSIDYGFWGAFAPVFAYAFYNNPKLKLISFTIGLIIVAYIYGGIQIYSIFAIFLLYLYSEKRGKYNLKYFFYIFYPGHLAVLYCVHMLIK